MSIARAAADVTSQSELSRERDESYEVTWIREDHVQAGSASFFAMLRRLACSLVTLSLVIALCSTLVAQRAILPEPAVWRSTNPGGGGWFERIAAGPTGTVIACSDLSGAYRSHDHGQTWEVLGPARGLLSTHASAVAFHATDPRMLYVGTEEGIFASADLGESFTHVLTSGYIESIAVAITDPSIAYAAWHAAWNVADGQIYATSDRGQTWRRVDNGFATGHRILEVQIAPDDPKTVYALTGHGRFANGPRAVFKSTDAGSTWTSIGAFQDRVVDIAIDRNAPSVLYASLIDAMPGQAGHLLQSLDRGATWTTLARQGGFIWVDRRDSRRLRTIDPEAQFPWDVLEGIWESRQGGANNTWSRIASVSSWSAQWSKAYWAFGATSAHGAFGEDESNPDVLYWVNSQFVFASFDGGKSVVPLFSNERGATSERWLSRGIDNVSIVALAASEASPDTLYAGFLDLGAWRSDDAGRSWVSINDKVATGAWAGSGGDTWTLVADPASAGRLWCAQGDGATQPSTLLRSADAGRTWARVGAGLPATTLLGLSLDAQSPVAGRQLFVSANGAVYGSDDDGVSFTQRATTTGLRCTHVDATRSDIVYAGGEAGFYRSTAGGAAQSFVETGPALMRGALSDLPLSGWEGVHAITTDVRRPGLVLAAVMGVDKGLYQSLDYGLTWTRLLADDFVRSVLIAPDDADHWLVATSSAVEAGGFDPRCRGILETRDAGQTFVSRNAGLAWPLGIPLASVRRSAGSTHSIFVGSPGTGIHELVGATLSSPQRSIHAAIGGTVDLDLDAGPLQAQQGYLLLASLSGTSPGLDVAPGMVLPINLDSLFVTSLQLVNTPIFVNSLGVLDNQGRTRAAFVAPLPVLQWLRGRRISFAYLTPSHASNSVSVVILP